MSSARRKLNRTSIKAVGKLYPLYEEALKRSADRIEHLEAALECVYKGAQDLKNWCDSADGIGLDRVAVDGTWVAVQSVMTEVFPDGLEPVESGSE